MANVEIHPHIASIGAGNWRRRCGDGDPFLNYGFLSALEDNDCVGAASGWHPRHLCLRDDDGVQAVMPVYLKDHSHGEFVFDWSWARAAQSAAIPYYPKLVTSIPYTPVSGPRCGYQDSAQLAQLLQGVADLAETSAASSWHLLFPDAQLSEALQAASGSMELLERRDCHFVWCNRNYQDFDDFLQTFSSRKRKNIKRERRRVQEQGIELRPLEGAEIGPALMDDFFQFYQLTYHRRGQRPYLNRGFFQQLLASLSDQLLLVVAYRDRQLVGAALFIKGEDTLYGRWWGGLPDIDCLHFEACYYQGIEYAIGAGLQRFDPGIQGEHKLLRGFEPQQTRSLHWIRDPRLAAAVQHWLVGERQEIDLYQQRAREHLPYRQS